MQISTFFIKKKVFAISFFMIRKLTYLIKAALLYLADARGMALPPPEYRNADGLGQD
jgi:hypothetical protein